MSLEEKAQALYFPESDNVDLPHVDKPKNGLFSFAEIMGRLSGTDYLIKPFLCTNSVGTLFGDSGTMKSFIAIDLGMCVAVGKDYHGFNVNQGSVVYVCGEGGGGIPKRLKAWCIEHDIDETNIPFFVTKLPVALINQVEVITIADDIQKACEAPALMIIDTLSANFGDGDESSNADMGRLLTNISIYFKEMGACVLLIHHVGHGDRGRERGAYSLRANVDFRIQVERLTETSPVTLRSLKVKDGATFDPIAFKPKVIPIPDLFDSEDVQETSVILKLDDYQEVPVTPTGGNLGLILSILTRECEARRKELKSRGSSALPWVPLAEWHKLFHEESEGTRKDSFKRSVRNLLESKVVIVSAGDLYRIPE